MISVHNIYSAGTLYTMSQLNTELSSIYFFKENTNFWMAAIGWGGKVIFVKTPIYQKASYSVPMLVKESAHSGDLFAIDHLDNFLATGGLDNNIVLWNFQTGNVRQKISVPKSGANIFICSLKFIKVKGMILLIVL